MEEQRRLLLVDDVEVSGGPLKQKLESAGWRVRWVTSANTARDVVEYAATTGERFDVFLVDLGLPPAINDPLAVGVPLVRHLHKVRPDVPTLAYTVHIAAFFPYELALRDLLPVRASFLHSREDYFLGHLPQLVDLVAKGFVIVSPEAAGALPRTIPQRADPFDDTDWKILQHMSNDETQQQIAERIPQLGADAVRRHVRQIKDTLIDGEWLESHEADQQGLKQWYNEHAARYRRDGRS